VKRCSALLTAICLASPACKEEQPAAPAAKVESPAAPPTSAPSPPAATPTAPKTPTVVEAPAPALATSYTAQLDPLLDLVPAAAQQFIVVRDPNEMLDEMSRTIAAMRPALLRALALDGSPDAEAIAMVKDFDDIRRKIAASGIELDRGMVLIDSSTDSDVFVFASADPESLNKLRVTLGDTSTPMKCQGLADAAGFVACAEKDDGALAKYVPAKAAATRRAELGAELAGVDLEQANVLGRLENKRMGDMVTLALSTVPGLVQLHLRTKLAADFEAFATPGPAPALALAPVGSSFAWGRFPPAFALEKAKAGPPVFGPLAATLTGEYFVGSIADPNALVALIGVTDPGPSSGLVAMFGLVQDKIPKTLPDGTTLAMNVESVEAGTGSGVQTVHATGSAGHTDLFTKVGLVPEGVAFAAGKYGAFVLGAGASAVGRIAKFDGAGTDAPIVSTLPDDFATALRDGKASMAFHIELDGLQNPTLRGILDQLVAELPASGGDPAPKDMLDIALGMSAPVSSTSVWITGDGPSIIHIAVRSYDEASPDRAFAKTARTDASAAALAPAVGGPLLLGTFGFFAFLGEKKEVATPPR
jgi:hypothetical protein